MSLKLKNLLNIKFSIVFLSLACFEVLSFLTYFYPGIRLYVFLAIFLVSLILAIKDLKYIFFISLSELIISSYGYLFFVNIGDFKLSLRITLWFVFLLVYFLKEVVSFLKNKKLFIINLKKDFKSFSHSRIISIFFSIILIGVFVGIFSGFNIKTIFSDANNWFFFFWFFPVFYIFNKSIKGGDKEKFLFQILFVFLVSNLWLIFKTLFFLFIFSHEVFYLMEPLYRWTRLNYLGEITALNSGFYRIFFQSHIYTLIFFLFSFFFVQYGKIKKKEKNILIIFLILSFSVILLTLSRSIWIGLIFSFLVYLIYLLFKKEYKRLRRTIFLSFATFIFSLALIFIVIKIPIAGGGNFSAISVLKERTNISEDSGALSSRWNLLPVLGKEVFSHPVIGRGFGAELSYKSNDPRFLDSNGENLYTTYAFEWGWLEIWFKLGFLGVFVYIFLLFKISQEAYLLKNKALSFSLIFSILSIVVVNMFTPYLNHPLVIGFIITIIFVIYFYNNNLENN